MTVSKTGMETVISLFLLYVALTVIFVYRRLGSAYFGVSKETLLICVMEICEAATPVFAAIAAAIISYALVEEP